MIAHRLATIRMADLIIILNNEHITQQVTHEELINNTRIVDGLKRVPLIPIR